MGTQLQKIIQGPFWPLFLSIVFVGQKNLGFYWQDTLKIYDFFMFVQEAATKLGPAAR
jgi:hypothetical protein